jgi:hypothetical protein
MLLPPLLPLIAAMLLLLVRLSGHHYLTIERSQYEDGVGCR